MTTQGPRKENLLYLDQITLQDVPNRKYTLSLFVENVEREVQRQENQIWTPTQRLDISPTSHIRAEVRQKSGDSFSEEYREASEIIDLHGLFNDYWSSSDNDFTVLKAVAIGKHSGTLELRFYTNATADALRLSLRELKKLLKEYLPLIRGLIEKSVDKVVIKYGAIFIRAAFGVANVTFELLKVQTKYDQTPSDLCDQLRRILPLAKKVADAVVSGDAQILKKLIPRMFEVMHRVAKVSCDYVKHAKTGGDLGYLEIIEEMDRVLTKAIEDFDRAVNAEVLQISIGRAKRGREEQEPAKQEPAKQEPAEQEPAGQEVLFPPNGCPDHGDEVASHNWVSIPCESARHPGQDAVNNFQVVNPSPPVDTSRPPSLWFARCHIPSHNWLSTPCECVLKQAPVNQHPASRRPPNAYPDHGDEAKFSFDDLDNFFNKHSLSSLTIDGGTPPPPNQAPASMMDEDVFSLEEVWLLSPPPEVQYFDGPQQSAPVQHLTIDTKDLVMASPGPFSPPMPDTNAIPIPSHISPGDPSLSMTPLLTPSSYSFSMSAGLSFEGASPRPPFGLQGSSQAPFVDTSYDELLNQGYPGNSSIACERRDVLRRTIANEIAQLPSTARDIKKLANIQRITDVIPEDLTSSGKKTTTCVLQCAWVNCNHYCTRPDRLKTHVYTHINFKPFPCDQSCGEPNCMARFYSRGDCNSHQTKAKKKKICDNCGEECTGMNWQRHARSIKCKNNRRRAFSFSI